MTTDRPHVTAERSLDAAQLTFDFRVLLARSAPVVLTIGHSTRTLEELVQLLQAHGVTRLVDVRTVPRSRHNPQFNRDTLPEALRGAQINYVHIPGLGGLRHAQPDSPNTGWRNASFRGFADYMQTPEFATSLAELIALATHERIAIMCAEAVPWRCHRSLIADALLARGIRVEHLYSATRSQPHALTPWAKVKGTRITYPAEAAASTDTPAEHKRVRPPARATRGRREKAERRPPLAHALFEGRDRG